MQGVKNLTTKNHKIFSYIVANFLASYSLNTQIKNTMVITRRDKIICQLSLPILNNNRKSYCRINIVKRHRQL